MSKKKLIITEEWTLLNPAIIEQTHKQRKLKWIIYLRVSTDQQKLEGHGLEYQETNCIKRAKENNIEVVKIFKDAWISGNSSSERKGFMDAINFLKTQNKKYTTINYFICDSTSRFSRNHKIEKTYELVWEVHQTWAELVAVSYGGVVDTKSELWMIQAWFSFLMDSLESKRGQTRVTNWMRARILSGYWTFSQPPTWYKFETEITNTWFQKHKRNKVLVSKEPEATILSEWLEMFGSGKLISKQDLYNFLCERGMKSNSKYNKSGKLHLSIIDRLLDPQKLYVYAWYLIYPDWWINDLIEAKHPALISLDTMNKILIKLWKYKWLANMKTKDYGANANDYPLRWVLYCPNCHKKMTWWASIWQNKWLHYYYGCNTKWCSLFKKTLRREQLHKEFIDLIKDITPPSNLSNLAEHIFDKIWKEKKNLKHKAEKHDKDKIKTLDKQLEVILDKILGIQNPLIQKELENKYEQLNQEKNTMIEKLWIDPFDDITKLNLLNDVKSIILNPLTIWEVWDHNMKKLLVTILFNAKIYYTKNQGYSTPDLTALYKLFQAFAGSNFLRGGP